MSSNIIEKVQATTLKEYKEFFKEIKERILTSQVKAALAVNHELINLYWEIGSKIHLKQKDEGWGAKPIHTPRFAACSLLRLMLSLNWRT